jgi:hypothetical protein
MGALGDAEEHQMRRGIAMRTRVSEHPQQCMNAHRGAFACRGADIAGD